MLAWEIHLAVEAHLAGQASAAEGRILVDAINTPFKDANSLLTTICIFV